MFSAIEWTNFKTKKKLVPIHWYKVHLEDTNQALISQGQ